MPNSQYLTSGRIKTPRVDGFFSSSDLRSRGWTSALIAQFLTEPCKLVQNPHHSLAGRMRLFSIDRVYDIESEATFHVARKKAKELSTKQLKRVRKQTSLLLTLSNTIPLDIPNMDFDELLVLAYEAYLSDRIEIKLMEDKVQANRLLAVEYLLQRCEPALWALDDFFQIGGIREARCALQHRILLTITKHYPELAQECARRAESILQE
jgi:hypothetical protein